jgi:hypothetical protein
MPLDIHSKPAACAHECARRHPRALFSVPVTLHHLMPGGIRASHGITLDISEGGLGALVQAGLRVGDTVEIDFPLPDCTLSTVAIVRHTSSVSSGFEFVGLTAEERSQIMSAVGDS